MIAVVADDYSGAAELAGIGFSRGLPSGVHTELGPNCPDDLAAFDTDTRSCPEPVAAERVAHIAGRVASCGPAWIFKKVDSVLRGPVLAELRSMLAATGKRRAILAPANPSHGRIIRAGHYFVDGRSIEHSAFRNDPEYPIRSSDVLTMLGARHSPDVRVANLAQDLPDAGIIVAEASTEEDVARWTAHVNPSTLAAGGADFFAALLAAKGHRRGESPLEEAEPPCGQTTLFVCGSAAAWERSREECAKQGIPFVPGLQTGSATSSLVETVVQVLLRENVARLFVEGGGTASALVRRMGWTHASVCRQYAPGVVAMHVDSVPAVIFTTKPGSYPWPKEVWETVCRDARRAT